MRRYPAGEVSDARRYQTRGAEGAYGKGGGGTEDRYRRAEEVSVRRAQAEVSRGRYPAEEVSRGGGIRRTEVSRGGGIRRAEGVSDARRGIRRAEVSDARS